MNRAFLCAAAGTVLSVCGFAALAQTQGRDASSGMMTLTTPGDEVTIAQGQILYGTHCASCHGADLEGQLDWRRRSDNGRMPAPPHNEYGHTWHHADRDLFAITKRGIGAVVPRYQSGMPVFGGMLSDAEIIVVFADIKSTWPDRQRVFQAEVTANDTNEK